MKMKIKSSLPRLTALLALLLPAAASAFELRPMTQTFEPAGRGANGTFEVHNDLDEEAAVTMTVKARKVDAEGVETLTDTKDFSIFPTEMMLKANSLQVVRVKWEGASTLPAEKSYRIIAEQVQLKQSKPEAAGQSGIKLVLRYGGTIYVAPAKTHPDIVVAEAKKVEAPGGAVLELDLENHGSRHAIIDSPSVSVKAGETTRRLTAAEMGEALAGTNILAGGKRRIQMPWPAGLPDGPLEAKLDASFLR
jgi:fimbrial chaperone protein